MDNVCVIIFLSGYFSCNFYLFNLLLLLFYSFFFSRAYLKSVAKKLAEDVDNLKTSASSLGKVKSFFPIWYIQYLRGQLEMPQCRNAKS